MIVPRDRPRIYMTREIDGNIRTLPMILKSIFRYKSSIIYRFLYLLLLIYTFDNPLLYYIY